MRWLDRLTHKTVLVHLVAGSSIRGVLRGVYADSIVLAHARYLYDQGHQDVDGEAVIPRAQVAWLQVLQPGSEHEQ